MGRPTKFTDAISAKIVALYKEGKTDAQVSKLVGISKRTLSYWKLKFDDFLHSIKESKSVADDLVEACLFARATGYNVKEVKVFCSYGNIVEHEVVKHYPPDVAAQIFWLKNRRPEIWRDMKLMQLPEALALPKKEKSFTEFCETAGYPTPYPKQIEMVTFGIAQKITRLLLGSRGYGKTDYVSIMGVAYDIYLNRNHTWMVITKEKKRASSIISEIAEALKKNGVMLDKENYQCIRVNGLLGKDHSVDARSIKSGLRGPHPYGIVMDDPVTEEDVSEAMRVLVERKYNEAYKLTPNILIIGQPAHKYDLYAKLRGVIETMEVPHGTIPELDHDLEAMKLAGVDEASISASYHLKVLSEGTTPFDQVKYMDAFPTGDSSVAWIDPSFKGTDYTAISIIKAHMQGVAVVGFTFKKAWNHCLDEILPHMKKYNVKKLAIECNSLGDQPVIMLRQLLKGTGIGVVGVDSVLNKHSKIMAAGSYAHLIHLSKESHKIYIDQVVKYEYKAEHDDAPDSLASCLEWIGLIRGKR